jgi:hypothetical protein
VNTGAGPAWQRADDLAVVDSQTVAELRRHWEDGWNNNDVDLIVEAFSNEVIFSSPFVPRILGADVHEIRGLAAVRSYIVDSFERATQGIRYRCEQVHAGTDSVALVYTVLHPKGDLPGLDVMRLNADNQVIDWRCHYPFD